MWAASFLIIAELFFGALVLGASSKPALLRQAKHEVKNVLGVSQLADVTADSQPSAPEHPAAEQPQPQSQPPASEPPQTSAPSAQAPSSPTNASNSSPSTSSTSDTAPTNTSPSEQSETPGDASKPQSSLNSTSPAPTSVQAQDQGTSQNSLSPADTAMPSQASEDTPTPLVSSRPTMTGPEKTTSPTPEIPETSASQTEAVLNPENLSNTAEHVDKESVDEVNKEEEAISKSQTEDEKQTLLITYAKDKLHDIEKNLKEDDFATTSFATTRLTDQIDEARQQIEKAPMSTQKKLTQQLSSFCHDADALLKNQELSVPEEFEQDMEISRAKCFDYQK